MAWKLASMGIPNTLVFLGFTGDIEIARTGRYFADDAHWQLAFATYALSSIPQKHLERDRSCLAIRQNNQTHGYGDSLTRSRLVLVISRATAHVARSRRYCA